MTREKLKFNEDMKQYVPAEQLWSLDWGGDMPFEYDHATYWPALNDMCRQRREERMRRWEAGGKLVGESEDFLAGGTDESVSGVKYDAGAAPVPASAAAVAVGDAEKSDGVDEVEEKLAQAKLDEKPVVA